MSCPPPTVKEAREDQKVIQYIDSCIKKANEASVSKAAKIQVDMTVTQQLMLIATSQCCCYCCFVVVQRNLR